MSRKSARNTPERKGAGPAPAGAGTPDAARRRLDKIRTTLAAAPLMQGLACEIEAFFDRHTEGLLAGDDPDFDAGRAARGRDAAQDEMLAFAYRQLRAAAIALDGRQVEFLARLICAVAGMSANGGKVPLGGVQYLTVMSPAALDPARMAGRKIPWFFEWLRCNRSGVAVPGWADWERLPVMLRLEWMERPQSAWIAGVAEAFYRLGDLHSALRYFEYCEALSGCEDDLALSRMRVIELGGCANPVRAVAELSWVVYVAIGKELQALEAQAAALLAAKARECDAGKLAGHFERGLHRTEYLVRYAFATHQEVEELVSGAWTAGQVQSRMHEQFQPFVDDIGKVLEADSEGRTLRWPPERFRTRRGPVKRKARDGQLDLDF